MARRYAVPYTGTFTNTGGNADLLELLPADDKPVKLIGFLLSQTSEVGDTAEEGIRISVVRLGATVTSSNGTSVTPVPLDSADTAAGFTAECNGATVATTNGTTTVVMEMGWNIRNSPYEWWAPDVSLAPKCKGGEGLFVRAETTPADDITVCLTFWVEEE